MEVVDIWVSDYHHYCQEEISREQYTPGAGVTVAGIVLLTSLSIAGPLRLRTKLLAVNLSLVLGALASTGKTPGHDPADQKHSKADGTLDHEGT